MAQVQGARWHSALTGPLAYRTGRRCDERRDRNGAEKAYLRAIGSGHPVYGPGAAFHLGVLRWLHCDGEGAEQAYQLAIDSGHPEATPGAAYNLGVLRERRENLADAEQAYQLAIDSGHLSIAPIATTA